MAVAVQIDIVADRWVWLIRKFTWLGQDFTGANFYAQVRQIPDGPGTPLLTLANANIATAPYGLALLYAGVATVSAHIAGGRLASVPKGTNPATGFPYAAADSVLLSQAEMWVNETNMRALPFPAERGDNAYFYYDLLVQAAGSGLREILLRGKFTVRAGSTVI
jgi:hypothetical protein